MESHQLVNQTSGEVEYYTPSPILDAARNLMGGIELDPASSESANQWVKAERIFTKEMNGLIQDWRADSLWMNHPFSREGNRLWINKLLGEYKKGNVREACCITYACTSEGWFQPLLQYPQCWLSPRTNYYLPDGTVKRGVTKGSVVTYLGTNIAGFAREFQELGVVKIAWGKEKTL